MELSYIIKIRIYILLASNLLLILFILNFRDFGYLIKYLKSIKTNKNQLQINERFIFAREKKLSKFFKVNKCLITSAYLFKTLKDLGFKANLFIGIRKDFNFNSHAWVEGMNNDHISEENKLFKEIIKVN